MDFHRLTCSAPCPGESDQEEEREETNGFGSREIGEALPQLEAESLPGAFGREAHFRTKLEEYALQRFEIEGST